MIVLTVKPGEEVITTLAVRAAEAGVSNGAVTSLIGAVDSCTISNMAADDALRDIPTNYQQPFELSGTGEIVDGRVHLHVVLSGEGDRALAGHLHRATVRTFFVNAYVVPLTG